MLPYVTVFSLMLVALLFSAPEAFASKVPLIKGGTGGNLNDITTILQDWIKQIRIIGVVVIVISIIIAAIIIGMSLGNAAKRALGVAALVSAVIGIILVMKAPDLANYFINQSQ
jgi:Type IV secretion system pilin